MTLSKNIVAIAIDIVIADTATITMKNILTTIIHLHHPRVYNTRGESIWTTMFVRTPFLAMLAHSEKNHNIFCRMDSAGLLSVSI